MSVGFFAVLDDIAMLMDDTAVVAKVATKKTASVLGDDLAVNAEQSSKFRAHRELPVIWAITKGSFINKAIILPMAFLLSYFIPQLIIPILILGGTYLGVEGIEKILDFLTNKGSSKEDLIAKSEEELLKDEKKKVKGAITTDFILSIEIIVIALGVVAGKPFAMQVIVVTGIAIIATVGVYGLVAMLVRLDDVGFWLVDKGVTSVGNFMIKLLPIVIKALGVIGTIAMLLVAGGIYMHNIDFIHHLVNPHVPGLLGELLVGFVVGSIAILPVMAYHKIKGKH